MMIVTAFYNSLTAFPPSHRDGHGIPRSAPSSSAETAPSSWREWMHPAQTSTCGASTAVRCSRGSCHHTAARSLDSRGCVTGAVGNATERTAVSAGKRHHDTTPRAPLWSRIVPANKQREQLAHDLPQLRMGDGPHGAPHRHATPHDRVHG